MGLSIGYVGLSPVPDSSRRTRGFLTEFLDEAASPGFNNDLDGWVSNLLEPDSPQTRLTIRVVGDRSVIESLRYREAVVPLTDDVAFAYLGFNAPARELSDAERERLKALRQRAASRSGPGGGADLEALASRFARAKFDGYTIEILETATERTAALAEYRDDLAALLRPFGYGDDLSSVIEEPDSPMAIAHHGAAVVGVSIAETVELPIHTPTKELQFTIAELTDSSVDSAHNGYGLQALMHVALIESVTSGARPMDVIFSESTYGASLQNAAMLGRSFVGMLENHVAIGEPTDDDSEYKSLEVTYFGADSARALVADLHRMGAS